MIRQKRRPATLAALLLAAGLFSGACTSDKSSDDEPNESPPPAVAQGVDLTVRRGVVAGELGAKRRRVVVRHLGAVVDRWFQGAYLAGDYPRTDFSDAFTGWTPGIRKSAKADARLLTNARIGRRIDGVVAVRRDVRIDLLSPRRRPAGATARFRLAFKTSGDLEQRVVVRGRLMLTRGKSGHWMVFGYDVSRSATPLASSAEGGQE